MRLSSLTERLKDWLKRGRPPRPSSYRDGPAQPVEPDDGRVGPPPRRREGGTNPGAGDYALYLGSWDDGIEWEDVWVLASDSGRSERRSTISVAADAGSAESRPWKSPLKRLLGSRAARIGTLVSLIVLSLFLVVLLG